MKGAIGIVTDHCRDEYALAQALAHSKSVVYVRSRRLPSEYSEDVASNLILASLASLKKFDSVRASLATFISRVMDNSLMSMKRRDLTVRRIPDAMTVRLTDSPAAAHRGSSPAPNLEFWLDFGHAVKNLTPALKETAEALCWLSPAEIARVSGCSRRTVYDRIQVLRNHLVQCGIGPNYFARGGGTR
jgi:DNA-directed RNA polymerase specialized sigma24 family protein